jgi:cold shock CspA family protein
MSADTTTTTTSSVPQLTGKVKWFNNKAGFGFITVCDDSGEQSGKDIFVHFSSIGVKDNQYKYLVLGEYVDFSLVKPDGGNHEFHAVDVKGIKGGSLMCETRKKTYAERTARTTTEARETTKKEVSEEVRRRTAPRKKRPEPVADKPKEDEGEYKKVVRKSSAKALASKSRPSATTSK